MNKKTGLDYFPLDVDFFQDEKIQFVSARFGTKGEAITVRLLCKIYRQGYYIDWNEDMALLFAKSVGDDVRDTLVNDVVYELLKRGFFDKSIFERCSILTSKGIQRRYFEAAVRRKEILYEPEYMLIDVSEYANSAPVSQNAPVQKQNVDILNENDNILKQSKGKESRVKESNNINADELSASKQIISDIIDYLNLKANKRFSKKVKNYNDLISGRISDGRTIDDLKYVIDVKCEEWLNTDMEKYLAPDTLFRPSKFDKYINQKLKNPAKESEPNKKFEEI